MSLSATLRRALVCGLLALQAVLMADSLRKNFVTVDEVGHVPAGLVHWQTGTFELYRVNPPLPRMLAVLPVVLAQPQSGYLPEPDIPGVRRESLVGLAFSTSNGPRLFDLVCLARAAGVGWALLGGWVIYRWAQELYGGAAGLVGLALWTFSPTVLAFGPLVVPDLPAAVAGLAATYAFWRYLRQPSWARAWFAGLLLGIAQLTKCTLLVLYGVWPLLWLMHRCSPTHGDAAPTQPARKVGHGLLIVLLSLVVLNAGYGFQGTGRLLGKYPFVSTTLAGPPPGGTGAYQCGQHGNRFRDSWLGRLPLPLPADYVLGIDLQKRDFEAGFASYLRGEIRHRGWWYYYLYALAVKVPLGAWALVAWALVLTLLRHASAARWSDELVLWAPALAVLLLVSCQTGFNHHMRYVFPMFPFVIVSTSKLGYFWQDGRWKTGLAVAALLLASAGSSLRNHPHHLSYFNEIAGGPDNGHKHLADSNIDWGQDLLFLKHWLEEHPEARPLGLAYFGSVDPRLVGMDFMLPPLAPTGLFPQDPEYLNRFGPCPGYYAVSVHLLCGLSHCVPDGQGDIRGVPMHGYSYFRQFQPVAKAGYSIFIYHITPEQADQARRRMGLPVLTGQP